MSRRPGRSPSSFLILSAVTFTFAMARARVSLFTNSATSAALPVGRQHVVLHACQISRAFLTRVVVFKFCPNVIIVVSRPPIGCMLTELSPNISRGAWCCVFLFPILNEGCIFHHPSVSARTAACHPHVDARDDWQVRLCLASCLRNWGKKEACHCCLLWVCWDYRELSLMSQTQPA